MLQLSAFEEMETFSIEQGTLGAYEEMVEVITGVGAVLNIDGPS